MKFYKKMELKEKYQRHVDQYTTEVATLKRKNSAFITGELFFFAAMLACVVCYFSLDGNTAKWLWGTGAFLLGYFLVRHQDDKNKLRIEHLSALLKVYQDELKALDGDFTPFETGVQYQDPKHPYAFDLDVFGKDSLFNRICRTITTGGSDKLAVQLSRVSPLPKENLKIRRELQQELAGAYPLENKKKLSGASHEEILGNDSWRMEFLALGEKNKNEIQNGPVPTYSQIHRLHVDMAAMPERKVIGYRKIDTAAVLDAIQKVAAIAVPAWFGSTLSLILGWLLIIGVCASVLLAIFDVVSINVPTFWVVLQYIVVFFVCKRILDKIDSHGGKLRHQLMAYSQILQLIAHRNFQSEMGQEMQAKLADALPSFAQLEKILKGYDRRGNFLGLFFTDSFMLSDFFLIRQFLKWKDTYMEKMEEWMDIVSEMDAMVSMADYRYNHPEATDAEIVDASEEIVQSNAASMSLGQPVVFDAKNLYHPFLGAKAVKNDFSIKDGNYYIITGANMAGKSTFLRSLGVNYILAMAGMPVFADSLQLSRFRLFSSMRTSDDLTHGISYFNAELLRLEQLMQFCQMEKPGDKTAMPKQENDLRTLIILDEILKGTNSVDKLNGSRLFLEAISQLPVSGIIATHDLELSKMEQQHAADKEADAMAGRFHNYCFEIELGTEVTYTYKITPGVARNQNATFLLKNLIERNFKKNI